MSHKSDELYANARRRILANTTLEPQSQCWVWMGRKTRGYGRINFRFNGGSHRSFAVHRVAWEAFHNRRIPKGRVIAHHFKCISPLCCNPKHLRATTQDMNVRDKKRAKNWREKQLRKGILYPPTLNIRNYVHPLKA